VGEFAIGQGVTRFEDPRLLKGGGRYLDDIVLARMAVVTHSRVKQDFAAAAH
jgi:CO/xanthine dehydrogenase Mo-binding subunit